MVSHIFQIDIRHRFASGFELDVQLHANDSVIGLMGPSGSGKSSLLLALAGVLEPDHAIIRFKEQQFADAMQRIPPRSRNIGLVTQDALLFPHLTVANNLRFGPGKTSKLEAKDPIIQMLEIDHLLNRNPRQLSGGERQRVALGRALLSKPQLLLADEPFSALDQDLKVRLLSQLHQYLSDTSTAVILSSHDAEVVEQLCSTTVQIALGSLHHKE